MTQMRFQRFIAVALAVLLVVLLGWAVGRLLEMQRAESRAAEAALARDSVQAVRDTTRAIHMDVAALAESLRVVQRRAVQTAQRADRLDPAFGLQRAARVGLRALLPPCTRKSPSPATPGVRGWSCAWTSTRWRSNCAWGAPRLPRRGYGQRLRL